MGAAIKAARPGAKTLLVEWQGSVGGVSAVGMMIRFAGNADSKLHRETLERAIEKISTAVDRFLQLIPKY